MSNIKERLLGAITVMTDDDAQVIWNIVLNHFEDKTWNNIETIQPDEIDLKMLSEIKNNPDCNDFITSEQLKKSLEL